MLLEILQNIDQSNTNYGRPLAQKINSRLPQVGIWEHSDTNNNAAPAETAATIEWDCYNDGLPQCVLAGFEFLLLRLRLLTKTQS